MTQDPRMVLPLQWEELVESESVDLKLVFNSMTKQIQNLLVQRDSFLEVAHLKGTLFHSLKCLYLRLHLYSLMLTELNINVWK